MRSKIFIDENFLPRVVCEAMIEGFKNSSDSIYQGGGNSIMSLLNQMHIPEANYAVSKINGFAQSSFDNVELFSHQCQIVSWDNKGGLDWHKDSPCDKATLIVYLNDNYSGGETLVGNTIVRPKQGLAVCFNGNEVLHRVAPLEGERYTIASWHCDYYDKDGDYQYYDNLIKEAEAGNE